MAMSCQTTPARFPGGASVHNAAEPDLRFDEMLAQEMPGILRWMINGSVDWYSNGQGLILPKAITEATTRYFDEQNIFGQWLEECCRAEPDNPSLFEKTAGLFQSWSQFAQC